MNDFFYDPWMLLLSFLLPGAALGAVYDIFRILRIARCDAKGSVIPKLLNRLKISKRTCLQNEKRRQQLEFWLIFAEDFLFCIVASLTELLLFFHLNGGIIRAPGLLLSAFGFFIYRFTLGRLVIGLAKQIICFLRQLIYRLLLLLCLPTVYLGRKLIRFMLWIKKRFHSIPKKGKVKESL